MEVIAGAEDTEMIIAMVTKDDGRERACDDGRRRVRNNGRERADGGGEKGAGEFEAPAVKVGLNPENCMGCGSKGGTKSSGGGLSNGCWGI